MMNKGKEDIEGRLLEAGIKPTSNRIMVFREICRSSRPLSLMELETVIGTLEKSSIFRVLSLLLEHGAVHAVEDGRGVVRYEVCTDHDQDSSSDSDLHAHFYCEGCNKVFCLESVPAPEVKLPEGYETRTVNCMFKGYCPECSRKRHKT